MQIARVNISEIKVPWGRLRNPHAVGLFAQRLRSGEVAPPVVLWHYRSTQYRFYCEDGRHRIEAAKSIGAKTIAAKIMDGAIEFYHHRAGPLCHRIVEQGPDARPARTSRRPTKKPR
jgi:hypothetical protein